MTTPPDALVATTHQGAETHHLITRVDADLKARRTWWFLRLARLLVTVMVAIAALLITPTTPRLPFLIGGVLGFAAALGCSWALARWRFGSLALEVVQTPDRLEVRSQGALYRSVSLPDEAIVQVFARQLEGGLFRLGNLSVFAELRDGTLTPLVDALPAETAHQLAAALTPAPTQQAPLPPGLLAISREGGVTVIDAWPPRRHRMLGLGALLWGVALLVTSLVAPQHVELSNALAACVFLAIWALDNHEALSTKHLRIGADGWHLTQRLLGVIPLQRAHGAPGELRVDHEGPVLLHDGQPLAWLPDALPARGVATIEAALDPAALPADAPAPRLEHEG